MPNGSNDFGYGIMKALNMAAMSGICGVMLMNICWDYLLEGAGHLAAMELYAAEPVWFMQEFLNLFSAAGQG